jgi:hypothetical protein
MRVGMRGGKTWSRGDHLVGEGVTGADTVCGNWEEDGRFLGGTGSCR